MFQFHKVQNLRNTCMLLCGIDLQGLYFQDENEQSEINAEYNTEAVPTRLCSDTIVPTHDCAHTRLCPDTIVPTHDCAHTRLCPHTIVHTHVCAQIRL